MKKIKLSIPEPCHEDWDQMQPDTCGRFCHLCQKTVIDFTVMSDEEIIKRVKNSNGRICGRLSEAQLNRPLEMPATQQPVFRKFSKIAAAAALLLPAFVTTAFAQKAATEQRPSQPVKGILLQGIILDHLSGQPLAGMEIHVEGISYPKYSDKDGRFHFVLPDSFRGREITVSARYLPGASAEARHSSIRSKAVLLDGERNEVVLTRYLLEDISTVTVASYPDIPRSGEVHISNGDVVTGSKAHGTPGAANGSRVKGKTSFRQWIKNIFRKRPN